MSGSNKNVLEGILEGVSKIMTEGQWPKTMSDPMSDKGPSPGIGTNEWWQSFRFPETPNFSVDNLMNCARSALFGQALGGGPAVHEDSFSGQIPVDVEVKDVNTRILNYITNELGGRLVYNVGARISFYTFSGGAISTIVEGNFVVDLPGLCEIQIVGTTKAHVQLGKDLLRTSISGE